MEVYTFKVALKYRRGLWRRIEIRGDQTLGDFDGIIREVFNHDTMDHLSEFFEGRWQHGGLGVIDPFREREGAYIQVKELDLTEGEELGYVYDFGDDIRHVATLERISEPEEGVEYPRLVSINKPRYRYCDSCKKRGKKTVATWVCIKCSDVESRKVVLCEECMEENHEDHPAEEMLY